MATALGMRRLVLDGEVVALDAQGRPSFERLQSRMHLASDAQVRRRARELPVTYIAFDLLWLEGRSALSLPYADRRRLLAGPGAGGAALAHARLPRGRRRGAAGGQRGAAAGGHRGQAPGLAVRARPPLGRVAQDQEPPLAGRGGGRLAARRGRPRVHARRPGRGRARRARRRAALRRQGGQRLHRRPRWRSTVRALEPLATGRVAVRRAASRRRARSSWSPSWWPTWSSANGPAPARCGRPCSGACARTWTRKRSCARRVDRARRVALGLWHARSGAGRFPSAS